MKKMKKMKKMKYILPIVSLLIISCKKNPGPEPTEPNPEPTQEYFKVFIGCEGNFGSANGSVSAYSPSTKEIISSYYHTANGSSLGDIVQSIEEIDGKNYIVVNNSGKIEVVDTANFENTGTINGLSSPREIKKTSSNIAYVSDLFSNSIQVIDLTTNSIINSISVSGWTESILVQNNISYITCPGANLVYKVDNTNHILLDSVITNDSPMNIIGDKNGDLWVLCSGQWGTNSATLERINTSSLSAFQVDTVINLNSSASKLCTNDAADVLYWIDGGVNSMHVDQVGSINTVISITSSGLGSSTNLYGLGIQETTGNIYATDAIDWTQAGKLYVFDNMGALLDSAITGIGPQAIHFR